MAMAQPAQSEQTEQKTTPPASAASADATSWLGTIDFGFRGGSTTGDRARYERYRDLRDGANVNLALKKEAPAYQFDVKGTNIGYLDQNLGANFANKRVKINGFFDQIPMNYGLDGLTKTPWTEASPGIWTLPDAAQAAVENKTAVGVLCAPGLAAGATCTPATASLALSQVSIYRGLAQGFDIKARRDTMGAGLIFAAAKDVDFNLSFKTTGKTGYKPFGMSFAFNNANELPLHLDDRTNELGVGLQWGSDEGMIRVAYDRSMYNQNIGSVTWDNPIRLTNWNDGGAIVGAEGPWDPSAYSNGNGPATGRIAMPPSNSLDMFSVTTLAKLPSHSTLSASAAFTTSQQDDALIPWTINPVIANAATYVVYPGLAQLPRSTAQAKMEGINATVNFTTRPSPWVGLTARYRYNDRKDRMPEFDGRNTVRFDGVPEPGPYFTEHHNATWSTANVDATFTPVRYTALKIGMGQDVYEHSPRAYDTLTDTSVRASIDTVGNQYVQLRALFERTRRVGSGFKEEAVTAPGGQENHRDFEDAERTRDRGTLLLTLTPVSMLDVTVSYANGKDVYDGAEQELGLMDNKNTSVNVGVNVTPSDKVTFGANYGQDKFNAFQRSRTANPFSGVAGAYESWTDPNRNWEMTNDEKVNNFDLYFDLIKALPNTDIRVAYNYSDSDNAFALGGPRIFAMQNNRILTPGDTAPCPAGFSSCFEPLPNVTNKWQRMSADLRHYFTKRLGLGVEYWYEKLEVTDYATINLPGTDTPRIDYLGSLTTGYGTRPYTGNTGFVRLLYRF
jgi:hypothetical protein